MSDFVDWIWASEWFHWLDGSGLLNDSVEWFRTVTDCLTDSASLWCSSTANITGYWNGCQLIGFKIGNPKLRIQIEFEWIRRRIFFCFRSYQIGSTNKTADFFWIPHCSSVNSENLLRHLKLNFQNLPKQWKTPEAASLKFKVTHLLNGI